MAFPTDAIDRRTILRLGAMLPLFSAISALAQSNIGLIDRLAPFWPVYDDTRRTEDRVHAIRDEYFAPERALYRSADIVTKIERLEVWLADFDKIADDVRNLYRRFPAAWTRHQAHFAKAFPDFRSDVAPVYLMLSLGDFDAHLEPSKGKLPLFFGLDGIVQYHGANADLAVLLDHESYHLYQGQVNPELSLDRRPPLFVTLWMEGTATWVSEMLNPQANSLAVLLNDSALAAASPDIIRRSAGALLARLDSKSDKDADRFFGAGHEGPEPARIGYLLGLQIARRLASRYSPSAIAHLDGRTVHGLCSDGLTAIMKG
jgi:hypothetical protein